MLQDANADKGQPRPWRPQLGLSHTDNASAGPSLTFCPLGACQGSTLLQHHHAIHYQCRARGLVVCGPWSRFWQPVRTQLCVLLLGNESVW